jgi:hypothetical protein
MHLVSRPHPSLLLDDDPERRGVPSTRVGCGFRAGASIGPGDLGAPPSSKGMDPSPHLAQQAPAVEGLPQAHLGAIAAADFFSVEVLTFSGEGHLPRRGVVGAWDKQYISPA